MDDYEYSIDGAKWKGSGPPELDFDTVIELDALSHLQRQNPGAIDLQLMGQTGSP